LSGLGFMGRKTGSWSYARTAIGLHAIWGVLVGLVYA
jgi:hypothetical protein